MWDHVYSSTYLVRGEALCGFGFIFNPRVRGWAGGLGLGGRRGERGAHNGKGVPPVPPFPPSHVMLTHSPFHLLRSLIPSFLGSVGLGPF